MNSKFKNPDEVYRGLDLWMVNDRLEDDELIHQVEEFRDKGLYSVIFRTYNGLCSDYPGEDYMHKAEVAIKAAERVGLKITLQAGYMPAANPIVLANNIFLERPIINLRIPSAAPSAVTFLLSICKLIS